MLFAYGEDAKAKVPVQSVPITVVVVTSGTSRQALVKCRVDFASSRPDAFVCIWFLNGMCISNIYTTLPHPYLAHLGNNFNSTKTIYRTWVRSSYSSTISRLRASSCVTRHGRSMASPLRYEASLHVSTQGAFYKRNALASGDISLRDAIYLNYTSCISIRRSHRPVY